MMGIFAIFALAILAVWIRLRWLAMSVIALGIVLTALMFLYHVTDTLQIHW